MVASATPHRTIPHHIQKVMHTQKRTYRHRHKHTHYINAKHTHTHPRTPNTSSVSHIHSLTHTLAHSFTHSLTQSFTHSRTHSPSPHSHARVFSSLPPHPALLPPPVFFSQCPRGVPCRLLCGDVGHRIRPRGRAADPHPPRGRGLRTQDEDVNGSREKKMSAEDVSVQALEPRACVEQKRSRGKNGGNFLCFATPCRWLCDFRKVYLIAYIRYLPPLRSRSKGSPLCAAIVYASKYQAGGLSRRAYLPFKVNSSGVMPIIFATAGLPPGGRGAYPTPPPREVVTVQEVFRKQWEGVRESCPAEVVVCVCL